MRSTAGASASGCRSTATFYVVRHAKAGSRSHWSGDDHARPLSKKGRKQAEALVAAFKPFAVSAIFTSPYLRCVQTIEPLAQARKLEVTHAPTLAEGSGLNGLTNFTIDLKLDNAVLCTHGDLVWELVEDLVKRKVIRPGEGGFEKGSTWVLEVSDGRLSRARYLAAP